MEEEPPVHQEDQPVDEHARMDLKMETRSVEAVDLVTPRMKRQLMAAEEEDDEGTQSRRLAIFPDPEADVGLQKLREIRSRKERQAEEAERVAKEQAQAVADAAARAILNAQSTFTFVKMLSDLIEFYLPRDKGGQLIQPFVNFAVEHFLLSIGALSRRSLFAGGHSAIPQVEALQTSHRIHTWGDFVGRIIEMLRLHPIPPPSSSAVNTLKTVKTFRGGEAVLEKVDVLLTDAFWMATRLHISNWEANCSRDIDLSILPEFLERVRGIPLQRVAAVMRSIVRDMSSLAQGENGQRAAGELFGPLTAQQGNDNFLKSPILCGNDEVTLQQSQAASSGIQQMNTFHGSANSKSESQSMVIGAQEQRSSLSFSTLQRQGPSAPIPIPQSPLKPLIYSCDRVEPFIPHRQCKTVFQLPASHYKSARAVEKKGDDDAPTNSTRKAIVDAVIARFTYRGRIISDDHSVDRMSRQELQTNLFCASSPSPSGTPPANYSFSSMSFPIESADHSGATAATGGHTLFNLGAVQDLCRRQFLPSPGSSAPTDQSRVSVASTQSSSDAPWGQATPTSISSTLRSRLLAGIGTPRDEDPNAATDASLRRASIRRATQSKPRRAAKMAPLLALVGTEIRLPGEALEQHWQRLLSMRFKLSVLRGSGMPLDQRNLWKSLWEKCFGEMARIGAILRDAILYGKVEEKEQLESLQNGVDGLSLKDLVEEVVNAAVEEHLRLEKQLGEFRRRTMENFEASLGRAATPAGVSRSLSTPLSQICSAVTHIDLSNVSFAQPIFRKERGNSALEREFAAGGPSALNDMVEKRLRRNSDYRLTTKAADTTKRSKREDSPHVPQKKMQFCNAPNGFALGLRMAASASPLSLQPSSVKKEAAAFSDGALRVSSAPLAARTTSPLVV